MGYRGVLAALVLALAGVATTAGAEPFSLRQALAYPFVDLLTATQQGRPDRLGAGGRRRAQRLGGRRARPDPSPGDPVQRPTTARS